MVYFEKSQPAPTCLAIEKAKANGSYNCEDVRVRLQFDFKNKCYICEQSHITNIQTEHFEAHQGNIDKKFDWNNLFFACGHCNNTKLAKYDNILNCTVKTDNVEENLYYRPIQLPRSRVEIIALEDDIKTQNTRDLLLDIYNGTTPAKIQESENIKLHLSQEIALFYKALLKFEKYKTDLKVQKKYLSKIKNILAELLNLQPSNGALLEKMTVIRRNLAIS